mgnify:CR=1 FL=1
MNRSERISKVLLDTRLFVPGTIYDLDDIYDVVEKNAELYDEDYEMENSSNDSKWKHTVRRLLQEVDGKRIIGGTRIVTYHGNKRYSFS